MNSILSRKALETEWPRTSCHHPLGSCETQKQVDLVVDGQSQLTVPAEHRSILLLLRLVVLGKHREHTEEADRPIRLVPEDLRLAWTPVLVVSSLWFSGSPGEAGCTGA